MTDLTDLQLLAKLPAMGEEGVVTNHWKKAEEGVGVTFPSAFMRSLDVSGGANFDDFLRVYRAGADNQNVDLLTQTYRARKTMATTRPHIQELLEAFRLPLNRLDQSNRVAVRVIPRWSGHNGRASW
ncbi:hypothetical protein ABZV31_38190 [Streptomyces sp. NPDC005202]|uniref:hypothetical protein n=1 Tax=Streptomyces sp. NPDC005202 TaxID=3157021 RepID=UPI0033B4C265